MSMNLDVQGYQPVKGTFGIEVELEGDLSTVNRRWWNIKEDFSLRSGLEYVLKKPCTPEQLPLVLEEFGEIIVDCNVINKSIRCSTHVHINVTSKTPREILHAIFRYYLVEEVLVDTQSNDRKGNLFCLRMKDSEYIGLSLLKAFLGDSSISDSFNQQEYKYGALNLAALNTFGSLEFRFLGPIKTPSELGLWCTIFDRIVNRDVLIQDDLALLKESPHKFLSRLLGPKEKKAITRFKTRDQLQRLLQTNLDTIESLAGLLQARVFRLEAFAIQDPEAGQQEFISLEDEVPISESDAPAQAAGWSEVSPVIDATTINTDTWDLPPGTFVSTDSPLFTPLDPTSPVPTPTPTPNTSPFFILNDDDF